MMQVLEVTIKQFGYIGGGIIVVFVLIAFVIMVFGILGAVVPSSQVFLANLSKVLVSPFIRKSKK